MRYEGTFPGYDFWRDGRLFAVPARTSTLTMTRRGDAIGFRLVQRNRKVRWMRTFDGNAQHAESSSVRISRALLAARFTLLDGEDIKLPARPNKNATKWLRECMGPPRGEGDDARLVFADVLTQRRDPRGELIVAQANAENGDAYAALKAERLLDQNRVHFLGPFADFLPGLQWRRGFVDTLLLDREQSTGVLDPNYDDPWVGGGRPPSLDVGWSLATLLTHESGDLLRDLTIGLDGGNGANNRPMHEALALLTALAPPSVEALTLRGAALWTADGYVGEVSSVLEALPRLRSFTAEGDLISFTPFTANELREITLRGNMNEQSLEALALATVPQLSQITISSSAISTNAAVSLGASFGSRLTLL